jgi:hypothetical protein
MNCRRVGNSIVADKENTVNGALLSPAVKKDAVPASPSSLKGAPLRLVDANKMIFAPSPKVKKQTVILVDRPEYKSEDYEPLTTMALVGVVKEKMDRLKGDLDNVLAE